MVAYGAVRGTLETGLTPVQVETDGTIPKVNAYGGQAEVGVYGNHSWKKSILGLDYRGDYRYNSRYKNFNGMNHALALDYQYQPTGRTQLLFREVAGSTNRAFGGFVAPVITDLQTQGLANNEVFDTRVYFMQTTGIVSHQTSARTTWNVGGDVFFVRRPDQALVSMNGYRALGAWDYRTNRRNSIGAIYTFIKYDYPRVYGGADIHGMALKFTRRATRNLDLLLLGGAYSIYAFGTQEVTLSPEVAAILGRPTGVEAYTRRTWIPQFEVTVRYTRERSRFTATATSGVNPGNGVYLTSRHDAASAGYSYAGIRRLSVGASAGYSRLRSRSLDLQNLEMFRAGIGSNYALTRLVNFSSQFDYRAYNAPGLRGREGFFVALGISVSPARIPLSIW
jgi:hypothetical protein